MDAWLILFKFAGGLGFFLYGIKAMSDGLQFVAGDRLRAFLEKGTSTPLRGILTGMLVTALIQSSSGTTVVTVGLVNAGLLTFKQAIGIIMGANIGTTITAYLIGFDLKAYALPIIAVGVLLNIFFVKKKRLSYAGQVILGFGLLFYGMDVMGQGMSPLENAPLFTTLMTNVENNVFLGVLVGSVFTGIVQSSSATIGILQELANQGMITVSQAVPILFGQNIGTTVTALLASIGTSVAARRTAVTHLLFNVIGTLIFLPLFLVGFFPLFVQGATNILATILPGTGGWESLNPRMQLAQYHGMFNVSCTILLVPFVNALAALVTWLIPVKGGDLDNSPQYLETRLLNNVPVALANAKRELLRMGHVASELLEQATNYFLSGTAESRSKALQLEETVDRLANEIDTYVVKAITNKELTPYLSSRSHTILVATGDLERIGDRAQNIVEFKDAVQQQNLEISKSAYEELERFAQLVKDLVALSLEALNKEDKALAASVIARDDVIDEMERDLRRGHVARINARICNGNVGAIYLDLLNNLERIGDHAVNLAGYVLGNGRDDDDKE